MKSVSAPLLLTLIIALCVGLAYYMYRDYRARHRHHVGSPLVIPCGPDDHDRKVYETREGKFCMEIETGDTIKWTLKTQGVWEDELVREFAKYVHEGDLVVDAGAYIGEHTMQLARMVGPKGRVIAFEPQLRIYEELLVNLDLNNIDNVWAEYAALGDTNTRVSMNVPKEVNVGANRIGSGGNRVELRTLDSYHLDKVAFMKIDVEGYEYELLQGAKETIARDHPVLSIEIWGKNVAHVMPLLQQYGYHTQQLAPDDYIALPN